MKVTTLWEDHFAPWGRLMRPSWDSTQATHWPHLRAFFGHLEVEGLTHGHLDAYRLQRSLERSRWGTLVTASTRNREVCSLTAAIKWGLRNGHVTAHPLRDAESEREKKRHRLCWTAEHARLLHDELLAANQVVPAAIVVFSFYTGLRPKETLALVWDDVVFHKGEQGRMFPALVNVRDPKNGEDRPVPLTPEAQAVIAARPRHQRKIFQVSRDTLNRQLRAAVTRARLPPGLQLYGARHGCGTRLRRAGVPQWDILQWMGHKDERSARVYQHFDTDDLLKAAAKVSSTTNKEHG